MVKLTGFGNEKLGLDVFKTSKTSFLILSESNFSAETAFEPVIKPNNTLAWFGRVKNALKPL
jgi:hypothetical protein